MSADAAEAARPPGGGSRRAALLAQGAQAAESQRLAQADVDRLRLSGSPEVRAELAGKFGRQYDELSSGQTRALADAVLELLVRDVERRVRQALSEAVATSPGLPPAIANALARDHIDVARPVLESSPVLSDDDLQDIVRTHAMQYALAVAGREQLSEPLTETLAELGSAEVVRRLVGNAGARISDKTIRSLADDYRDDREIQDRLVRRPALPYDLVDQLVGEIGERLEWDLVQKRRMGAAEARQIMRAVRDTATLSIVARDHGERSLEREMRQRLLEGELDPEAVLLHLRNGEIRCVEAGLAVLAGVEVEKAHRLLYGMDKRGIAALCARAGFGTAHYATLRMTLDLAEKGVESKGRDALYTEETMLFIQRQYDEIAADETLLASLLED